MLRLTHAGVLLLLKKPADGSYRISLRVMRESAEKHTVKGLFGPCARGGAARDGGRGTRAGLAGTWRRAKELGGRGGSGLAG